MPDTLPTNSPEAICRATYRTGTDFLTLFNPDKQGEYTANLERCYMGTAPALGTVGRAFGAHIAESWLAIQLKDLSEFAGNKGKLNMPQYESAAKVIKAEFGYMTVTQLMHFFQLFKGGRYGKFYGAVDPITITEALHQYARDRHDMIVGYEKEARRREKQERERRDGEEIRRFNEALAVSNMSPAERIELLNRHGLTLEEVAEIGWLFRI